jgi:hypothetical protein
VVAHSPVLEQAVALAPPFKIIVDPGPGLLGKKPLPCTFSGNPPAAPAVTLAGSSVFTDGPVEIVTPAKPERLVSSALVAETWIESGEGGASGAV